MPKAIEAVWKIESAVWTRRGEEASASGCYHEAPPLVKVWRGFKFQSGPGATRTRDLLLRRQALYPTELRTRKDLDPLGQQ